MITVPEARVPRRFVVVLALVAAAASAAIWTVTPVSAVSSTIVISQVYGGGGNAGATLRNDFIELYNRGAAPANLSGWSVQYASSAGTSWAVTPLTGVMLQPGQYYLVQEAQGTGGTTNLPPPDAVGTIAMSATSGKVALVSNVTALTGSGCPFAASVVDFVGYGTANCSETAATPALTNTTAALRKVNGATETDSNSADFEVGAPNPRNSAVPTSTTPSGIGSATPPAVNPGQSVLLTVAVTPGTNPASASLTVTADLSEASGSPSQQFFDDGSNGDVTIGDFVFSYALTTPTTPNTYSVPFTVSDNLARSTSGTFSFTVQAVVGPPPPIVISQVYGGGGNTGATWKNDFIELFNPSALPVTVNGWSVQYASGTGTTWQTTTLSGVIPAGHYYLVREAAGLGGTTDLPIPDDAGTPGIPMSGTAGKVALVTNNTMLTGGCPTTAAIVDFVGYGSTANCFEGGGPTPAPSNTTAAKRQANGCVDTNNNNADFFSGTPVPRNSGIAGDCTVTPGIPLAIHDIQGPGNASPYATQLVTTTGVVTATKFNGFFLQALDSEIDVDANTSEGVFVFTSSAPPSTAALGNYVEVTATVQEFLPDPTAGSITELSSNPTVTLFGTGYAQPSPRVLTVADTSPLGGREQLEKYEGMRVTIPSLTVIAPTEGNVSEANASSTSNGVFYGVITGIARPLREPGIEVGDPLPPGTPPNVPRFDANPERIRVDSDALTGATAINVTTGAVVTNLVGPLDYAFGTYAVYPDPAAPPTVTGNITAIPVPAPTATEFTVASFNMERFFDTDNDPDIGEPVLTPAAFERRLNKASLAIRNVLRMPDVIGVEEMENLTTLQTLALRLNADAVAAGQPDPQYQAILLEGNDIGGIDVGFLVKGADGSPGVPRVTIDGAAVQIGDDATYINPNNGEAELLNDRPSLLLKVIVTTAAGFRPPLPVTIIVNHLRSLSGVDDPVDGNRVRTKRRAQAEYLANFIQSRQTANPDERIVLVGDFNAFELNDGYVDVMGTIVGTPTPADEVVLASADLVNPDLEDLVFRKPLGERYSFVFDGTAQELDHVLVTEGLAPLVSRFEYARNDADFPESFRNDASRPERISDHDMVVAYIVPPPDTTAPAIGSVTPSVTTIWPPNKKMMPVAIEVTVSDDADPSPVCQVTGITSNEGSSADWQITGPMSVVLRADRDGKGSGRVYKVAVSCTDLSGNVATVTTSVAVPHDQGK